ncbi:hypothetical protein BaRGS_00003542 [Batillaria attramentaria]|uniref:Aquaporin n=1 Tax=Batillaria attramentaria TaxID=370345 RepID=A0ABD0M1G0_9CAEN
MPKAELVGLGELRTAVFYRRLVAEALGSAILVIFGCGSAMTVDTGKAPTVITIAVAFGLTVATVIWSLGNVSGAHINPCVSITMFVTRKISLTRTLAYIAVQCVGCTGLGVEILATFVLVLAIYASCDRLRSDHTGSVALAIGFVVTMDIPWAIQYTGASMNPARSLGPCILTGLWDHHWVFWVGPTLGALTAGLLYEHLFHQRHFVSRGFKSRGDHNTRTREEDHKEHQNILLEHDD